MNDILSKKERSIAMSKVRSVDTKPEWILRCGLHRLGFRYRLKNRHLPGQPDLAFPKYRSVVFVHGCYWHRHAGCGDASMPKSNVAFWTEKFAQNKERDHQNERKLIKQGWRVLVVWECELENHTVETIEKAAHWLCHGTIAVSHFREGESFIDRRRLLGLAEKKIRYRIDSYDEKK